MIASQEKTPSMNKKKKELRGSWGDVFLDVSVDWCIKKSSALWEDRQVTDIKFASIVIDVKNMFFWFQLLVYTVYSLVSLKSGATDF